MLRIYDALVNKLLMPCSLSSRLALYKFGDYDCSKSVANIDAPSINFFSIEDFYVNYLTRGLHIGV